MQPIEDKALACTRCGGIPLSVLRRDRLMTTIESVTQAPAEPEAEPRKVWDAGSRVSLDAGGGHHWRVRHQPAGCQLF